MESEGITDDPLSGLSEEFLLTLPYDGLNELLQIEEQKNEILKREERIAEARIIGMKKQGINLGKDLDMFEERLKLFRMRNRDIEKLNHVIHLDILELRKQIEENLKDFQFLKRNFHSVKNRLDSGNMKKNRIESQLGKGLMNKLKMDLELKDRGGSLLLQDNSETKKYESFISRGKVYPKKSLDNWDHLDLMFWLLDIGLYSQCSKLFKKYEIRNISDLEERKGKLKDELILRKMKLEHLVLWKNHTYLLNCYRNNEEFSPDWGIVMKKLSHFSDFESIMGTDDFTQMSMSSPLLDWTDLEKLINYLSGSEELVRNMNLKPKVQEPTKHVDAWILILDDRFAKKAVEVINLGEVMNFEIRPVSHDHAPFTLGLLIGSWIFCFEEDSELVVPTTCSKSSISYSHLTSQEFEKTAIWLGRINIQSYSASVRAIADIIKKFNTMPYVDDRVNSFTFVWEVCDLMNLKIIPKKHKAYWNKKLTEMKSKGYIDSLR